MNIGGGITSQLAFEIAQGQHPDKSTMLKFGENPDLAANTFEDIWDATGTYVPPTQARLHNVVSSTASDDGTAISSGTLTGGSITTIVDSGATFQSQGTPVAVGDIVLNDSNTELGNVTAVTSETTLTMSGSMRNPNSGAIASPNATGESYRVVHNDSTGASILHLLGLDGAFLEIEEFVVMNGVANVATANTYIRQYRARVFGPNTSGAVGTITSTAQTDGTVSCQVIDGNNQTLMAIYTVPSNQNGYIIKWWASISNKVSAVADVQLRAGTIDGIGYLLQTRAIDTNGKSDFDYLYAVPELVPGGSDIWAEATVSTVNAGVSAGFDIVLVDV